MSGHMSGLSYEYFALVPQLPASLQSGFPHFIKTMTGKKLHPSVLAHIVPSATVWFLELVGARDVMLSIDEYSRTEWKS